MPNLRPPGHRRSPDQPDRLLARLGRATVRRFVTCHNRDSANAAKIGRRPSFGARARGRAHKT